MKTKHTIGDDEELLKSKFRYFRQLERSLLKLSKHVMSERCTICPVCLLNYQIWEPVHTGYEIAKL